MAEEWWLCCWSLKVIDTGSGSRGKVDFLIFVFSVVLKSQKVKETVVWTANLANPAKDRSYGGMSVVKRILLTTPY